MGIADDIYEIDAHGHRVLVGLTFAETEEFIRLEAAIADPEVFVSIVADDWRLPDERRWLELYIRHQAAVQALRTGRKPRAP